MNSPSETPHPLIGRTGTSQRTRVIDALDANSAPVDGKTLAERLKIISNYAQQINYYEYINIGGEEFQEIDNWQSFFTNSLPFQLAIFNETSIKEIEREFTILYNQLTRNPSQQALESLLVFIYDKLIISAEEIFNSVDRERNSFSISLLSIIKSSYQEPLKSYVAIYNASATFLGISKRNFNNLLLPPWKLGVTDVYALDTKIQQSKKGIKEAIVIATNSLKNIFEEIVKGLTTIVNEAPAFIEEALVPLESSLQKNHQPHIGLLFTFLELFKYLENDVNNLTQKHLDFFYLQVLKIKPREASPDKAHVIFEIAKHLDQYLLPQDLLLKDGKDANKEDIQFGLDHDLVIDKAQVSELRTLSLNKTEQGDFIEGVYVAPLANSIDGLGGKFKANQSSNWPTLGAKYSKLVQDGNQLANEHPKGRVGFVLSSPVLFLQEGKRTINISLECRVNPKEDINLQQISELLNFVNKGNDSTVDDHTKKEVRVLTQKRFQECLRMWPDDAVSVVAKSYITNVLLKENSISVDKDKLDQFFGVKDEVSCLPIFSPQDRSNIEGCFVNEQQLIPRLFTIQFSGEEEWLVPKDEDVTVVVTNIPEGLKFEITIELAPDFLPIVFYNEEVLEEKIDLKKVFPLVKIELNPEFEICLEYNDNLDECFLKGVSNAESIISVSPYYFLQGSEIIDANIDVEVCGVKNLIVQNDNNLQDINKPIQPFGPRPKVGGMFGEEEEKEMFIDGGANFYIGSKEIFCKNWQKFWINTTWKDKPLDLHEHYRFYRIGDFEDGNPAITDTSFRFLTSVLYDGNWIKDSVHINKGEGLAQVESVPTASQPEGPNPVFGVDYTQDYCSISELYPLFDNSLDTDGNIPKLDPNDPDKDLTPPSLDSNKINPCGALLESQRATYRHTLLDQDFDNYLYRNKSMLPEPLEPLTVNTRKGFVKLTLAGVSFQHELYTYVLTRQMMALAGLIDPESIKTVEVDLTNSKVLQVVLSEKLEAICNKIGVIKGELATATSSAATITGEIGAIIIALNEELKKLNDEDQNTQTDVLSAIDLVSSDLSSFSATLVTISGNTGNSINIVGPQGNPPVTNTIENTLAKIEIRLDTEVLALIDLIKIELDKVADPNDATGDLASAITQIVKVIETLGESTDSNVIITGDPNNMLTIFSDFENLQVELASLRGALLTTIKNLIDGLKIDVDTTKGNNDVISGQVSDIYNNIKGLESRLIALNTVAGGGDSSIGRIGTCIQEIEVLITHAENQSNIPNDKFTDEPASIDQISIGRDNQGNENDPKDYGVKIMLKDLGSRIDRIRTNLKIDDKLGLPQEPYTPTIKSLSLDYVATAAKDDMDIVHLYPFENTSKFEDIEQGPTLFPLINEEGTLFLGIENLTLGGNVSLLFQLAEATADSEMNRAKVNWHYLSNNNWVPLLPDFNIISDETDGLTVSGIVNIAIPDDISKVGNTVMPDHLYWIKVSSLSNAKAVAETIGIHTQAAKTSARISDANDTGRLVTALEAGSVNKLLEGDFSIKKVQQLYPSFGGSQPEKDGPFYTRVSEHLKHKGRGVLLSDYERIVLERFPEIYKTKCISHAMGLSAITYQKDLEVAPGYIVITVIPDLTKLLSGNQLAPKAPVSLLEKIEKYLRNRISPFARIKVMNPRYELVDVTITVRLVRGKSENFFGKKLKEDITNLLSPWFLGDTEKLAFGMPVLYSDIVGFVEGLDYVDFIAQLELTDENGMPNRKITPMTARSILTSGEICVVIDNEKCEEEISMKDTSVEFETNNQPFELS